MRYLLVLPLVFIAACSATDPLTLKNLEHAEAIFEATHRPLVSIEQFEAMTEDEQTMYLIDLEYTTHKRFFDSAIEYEKSKGKKDE